MGAVTASHQILLYYLYAPIADPEGFAEAQRELCGRLGLLGRIIVASEGINGTLSGEAGAAAEYMAAMREDPRFAGIVFKTDPAEAHAFPRLSVKVRPELVTLGLTGAEDVDPRSLTGERLSPRAFLEAMSDPGAVVLDGRNRYEWELGRFKGAVCPDVDHFRDLPKWLAENLEGAKERRILTYCTGGIRCEKLSGLLVKEGFKSVAQLDGGIVSYGKDPEVRGRDFEGRCYVFDERVAVPVNSANPTVVSRCRRCGGPSERYVNCALRRCNAQIFLCAACESGAGRYCDDGCRHADDPAYLERLPHGEGFRFVDALLKLEPGNWGVASYRVTGREPFLPGHFPGDPIVPGVVLAEAVAQLAGVVAQSDPEVPPVEQLLLAGLGRVKISGAARPGDTLRIEAKVTGRMGGLVQADGSVEIDGVRLCSATVSLGGAR